MLRKYGSGFITLFMCQCNTHPTIQSRTMIEGVQKTYESVMLPPLFALIESRLPDGTSLVLHLHTGRNLLKAGLLKSLMAWIKFIFIFKISTQVVTSSKNETPKLAVFTMYF